MQRMKKSWRAISNEERAEIWRRWRGGASYAELARLLTRSAATVWNVLHRKYFSGIRPRPRRRSANQLSASERERISRALATNDSFREIARCLGRPPSTISREVARNGGRRAYRAQNAEKRAASSARRPKPCKLSQHWRLRRLVASKLRRRWSPQQIAAWLKLQHPEDECMQVSHETIYQSLYIQARGVLKAELVKYLRSHRRARRAQNPRKTERRGKISNTISIRERPASVEDRAVPGHWEGDLLVGTHRSYVATLVERKSRFVMLVKVPSKESTAVVDALIKQARKLPVELRRSLTWDRGHELAQHKRFSLATDMKVFCDPRSPWQRGTNENTNGLLRQYYPKGESLSTYSQADLNRVAREINERP
jgi:IS30 family transposase